eukprot:SAG31_NODE_127_length_23612_cov_39.709863_1_plen_111_part_00
MQSSHAAAIHSVNGDVPAVTNEKTTVCVREPKVDRAECLQGEVASSLDQQSPVPEKVVARWDGENCRSACHSGVDSLLESGGGICRARGKHHATRVAIWTQLVCLGINWE